MKKLSMRQFEKYLQTGGGTKCIMANQVRKQLGCDTIEEFFQTLTDVLTPYGCGANGGFAGFIYYTETTDFFYNNRKCIMDWAEELADELGEDVIAMVRKFNSLGNVFSYSEVAKTLYGAREEGCEGIADVMAKFALEEVANWFDNYKNNNE